MCAQCPGSAKPAPRSAHCREPSQCVHPGSEATPTCPEPFDECSAWMSWTSWGTLALECRVTFALFLGWRKVRKPPSPGSFASPSEPAGEREKKMTLANPAQGENLEDFHREYQRSAPQSAQKYVPHQNAALSRGKTLKTRNSPSTTRNWNVDEETIVGTSTSCSTSCGSRKTARIGSVLRKDLGHFDNLFGIGREPVEELEHVWQLSTVCGTGASRVCTMGAKQTKSTMCSTVCFWTRSCGRRSDENLGPHPRGVFVKQLEEHRFPRCFGLLSPKSFVRSLPGPVGLLCPWARRTFHQQPPCRSCGGRLRTRPLRRSAAHVATISAGVAAFSAMRSRGRHAASCRPPGF